jgi:hypothetical protein
VPNRAYCLGICIRRLSTSYEMSASVTHPALSFMLLSQALWLAVVNVSGSSKRRNGINIENVGSHSNRNISGGFCNKSSH